jgi:hypothetical protein
MVPRATKGKAMDYSREIYGALHRPPFWLDDGDFLYTPDNEEDEWDGGDNSQHDD